MEFHDTCDIWEFLAVWLVEMRGRITFERDFEVWGWHWWRHQQRSAQSQLASLFKVLVKCPFWKAFFDYGPSQQGFSKLGCTDTIPWFLIFNSVRYQHPRNIWWSKCKIPISFYLFFPARSHRTWRSSRSSASRRRSWRASVPISSSGYCPTPTSRSWWKPWDFCVTCSPINPWVQDTVNKPTSIAVQ